MTFIRDRIRQLAYRYALGSGEKLEFDELWKLRKRASKFAARHEDDIEAAVSDAFAAVATVLVGKASTEPGHTSVEQRPLTGRYVVFSDHHLAHTGHRQDFFGWSGNRDLYVETLAAYADKGWTVVENGDVEELVIQDPDYDIAKKLGRTKFKDIDGVRRPLRLEQLRRIVSDPKLRAYYEMLAALSQDGRYVKILGNHETDLHDREFADLYRLAVPGVEPVDHLLITAPGAQPDPLPDDHHGFLVTHGHQFDKATTPRYAGRVGEAFSESLAWAFEGADRRWIWRDQVADWATGKLGFRNVLVTDDFELKRCKLLDGLGFASGFLNDPAGYEAMFGHNVAWEYFEHPPQDAIVKEVETGDEFFKYRHLDEVDVQARFVALCDDIEAKHPGATCRPTLVLGHSHEVRLQPGASEDDPLRPVGRYINSGAAGRFENLLWAVEIDAGKPRVVAWSRDRGPRAGVAERRVFDAVGDGKRRVLRARQDPAPVP